MSDIFVKAMILIIVFQFAWNGVSSVGCPSRTVDVYFSAEQVPVLHAPNGDFTMSKLVQFELRKISSLTLDYKKQRLFVPDWEVPNATCVFDLSSKNKTTIGQEREHFSELTTDTITGNVYFISQHNIIGVCDANLGNCQRLLDLDLDKRIKRRNLQLHPRRGLMFWVDDYITTKVQMAKMDGTDLRSFNPYDDFVYSISLDAQHNMMYIALPDKIERINLDTKERSTFLEIKSSHLYYFDCKLAVKPRELNKFSVYSVEDKSHVHTSNLYGNALFLVANSDEKTSPNPCAGSSCNGLCVINGETSTNCVCDGCNKPTTEAPPEEPTFKLAWYYVIFIILGLIILAMTISMCCVNRKYKRILTDLHDIRTVKTTPTIPINGFTDRHEF